MAVALAFKRTDLEHPRFPGIHTGPPYATLSRALVRTTNVGAIRREHSFEAH
jgi:hypothetical protein